MSPVLTLKLESIEPGLPLAIDEQLTLSAPTAIFGPSGAGKSSLLKAIAGLSRSARGRIAFGESVWLDDERRHFTPPWERAVTLVLQASGLFSHCSVADNLTLAERFSARRRRIQPVAALRAQTVDALDLGPLLHRRPAQLSGGEQKRVALGRALLAQPELLLLDEPFAGIDTHRKREILPYLERALKAVGCPALLVSHDIDEVAALCPQLLVMDSGRVRLAGDTTTVLEDLALTPYTGRFEAGVLVPATVLAHHPDRFLTELKLGDAILSVPHAPRLKLGEAVQLRIRSRDVAVATEPPRGLSIRNVLPGTLQALIDDTEPGFVDARIDVGSVRLRARLTRDAVQELGLTAGQPIYALIKSVSFDLG